MLFKDYLIPNDKEELLQCFYNEIVEDREYDRFGVKVEPGDVVVDCGANIGIFSHYALDKQQASRVYSFESDPYWFKYLHFNTFDNPNIHAHLGSVSPNEWNIQKIIETYNLPQIDFLKIDIEGGEFGLIVDTPNEVLSKVNKMAIEIHMGSSNNGEWLLKMLDKLSENGFDIKLEWVHRDYDVAMLYVKK
jgi:hypothetical protein